MYPTCIGQSDGGGLSSGSRHRHAWAQMVTVIIIPPTGGVGTSTINMPQYHTFLFSHRIYNQDGEPIGVYFQNAHGHFLHPLPPASLRCIMLNVDSDDPALLANWAMMALSMVQCHTFLDI